MQQAIKDANLAEEEIQDPDSVCTPHPEDPCGLFTNTLKKWTAEESWPVILLRLLPQLQEL